MFDEMGGLPEHFAVAFNDLEYCLRVRDGGRRIIWTPQATLSHFESQSRGRGVSPDEVDELYRRWGEQLRHDPYGNPQFAPYQAEWVPRWRADTSLGIRRRLRTLRNVADVCAALGRAHSVGERSAAVDIDVDIDLDLDVALDADIECDESRRSRRVGHLELVRALAPVEHPPRRTVRQREVERVLAVEELDVAHVDVHGVIAVEVS
ncbi:MAG: hypothetical protein WKF58_10935 [Ilumatobacteraceae bacterium]